MNIIYLDWPCFNSVDTILTFEQFGHNVIRFFHPDYQNHSSDAFIREFQSTAHTCHADCCYSYNYYPIVATCCHQLNIPYISFVYDSPFVLLYSYTLIYPTNFVFLFDKAQYYEFKNAGIDTVYYHVLPVNGSIIHTLLTKKYDKSRLSAEVSFVGALYNEKHNYYDTLLGHNDYLDGFLAGLIDAQQQINGLNFIEDTLSPDIVHMLQQISPYHPDADSVVTPTYIYANYYINRKITQLDRISALTAIGERYKVRLFTLDPNSYISGVENMGICDYYSEMPYLFHNSKINLNISLRSIKSGIPLRCMDIMGNGGFLLSNYQSDLADFFEADSEFVFYDGNKQLVEKIGYYLKHNDEREEIARRGHKKVVEQFNYPAVFKEILDVVFH